MTEDESGKKTNAKAKRITTVTRTVTVNIDYQYIRAIDNTVLGRFNKNTSSSESFEESQPKLFADVLLEIFILKEASVKTLAKHALKDFSNDAGKELGTWTSIENREIVVNAEKSNDLGKAKMLVAWKKYSDAQLLYKKVYEETGNLAAGYNAAILMEANGQFIEALALLEELQEKLSKGRLRSAPPPVKNEITRLSKLIEDLKTVDALNK
jgi:hypothetical protein